MTYDHDTHARRPSRPRPSRDDLFYPQVELLRAQRALRREKAGQRTAKLVAMAIVIGLYWLAFAHMR